MSGILINGGDVRVAVQSPTWPTRSGVSSASATNTIGGRRPGRDHRRHVADRGPALHQRPRALRRRRRAMRRQSNNFQDLVATANTSCLGTARRRPADARRHGAGLQRRQSQQRPVQPRPDHLAGRAGRGCQATTRELPRVRRARHPQLRVAPPSNVFYNGVTAGTNANTLKAIEAGSVGTGYPGPDFPPVTRRPIRTTRSGSSMATRRKSSSTRSRPLLRRRRDPAPRSIRGTVITIPDFTYAVARHGHDRRRTRSGTGR